MTKPATAAEVVRAALIHARYPLDGYPDPINPEEDRVPYGLMAGQRSSRCARQDYSVTDTAAMP